MSNQVLGAEFKSHPRGNSIAEYDGFSVSYAGPSHPALVMLLLKGMRLDTEPKP